MARLPRLYAPGCPQHVIQRGNAQRPVFLDDKDRVAYLGWLADAVRDYHLALYAYVLMDNHVHLLLTPPADGALGRALQSLGRRYVRYFNDRHKKSGALWEGRYRATIIDSERYLIDCMRYIDLNPVRSGAVPDADVFPWSSYHHHAGVQINPLLTDPPQYWALGNTPFARQEAWRRLCTEGVAATDVLAIRTATNKGWALGGEAFTRAISETASRRPLPSPKRGRPRLEINSVPD